MFSSISNAIPEWVDETDSADGAVYHRLQVVERGWLNTLGEIEEEHPGRWWVFVNLSKGEMLTSISTIEEARAVWLEMAIRMATARLAQLQAMKEQADARV